MKDWGHMKFENVIWNLKSEIACWNTFQAKHSVTHGNWITIIIMLIHWSNSFHHLNLQFTLRWKIEDIWNSNESEIAWIPF